MIRVLFYKGTKRENPGTHILDQLICWWTGSRFSHVEFVVAIDSDGRWARTWSASPRDGAVRTTLIDLGTNRWELATLPGDPDYALRWFESKAGAGYSWLGAMGFVCPVFFWLARKVGQGRFYCSEAIACAMGPACPDKKKTPEDLHQLRTE